MNILLDTSAYSVSWRGHRHLEDYIRQAERVYMSPVALGELRAGYLRGSRREENEEQLRRFLASPRVIVPEITGETADRYASIRSSLLNAGTPIPTNDIWIAAGAMQHGLELLTTDAHYLKVPQVLVRYFEPTAR